MIIESIGLSVNNRPQATTRSTAEPGDSPPLYIFVKSKGVPSFHLKG